MVYVLPKKERDERVGDAIARGVTTGTVSAGRVIRDTAHEQAPDLAANAGRGLTNTAMNVGTGVKEAVVARKAQADGKGAQTGQSTMQGLGNRIAHAAVDFKAGVDEVRQPVTETTGTPKDSPEQAGARGFGHRITQAAMDLKAGVEDAKKRPAKEESSASSGPTEQEVKGPSGDPEKPA